LYWFFGRSLVGQEAPPLGSMQPVLSLPTVLSSPSGAAAGTPAGNTTVPEGWRLYTFFQPG